MLPSFSKTPVSLSGTLKYVKISDVLTVERAITVSKDLFVYSAE
jgi:hypothetical protein